MPDMPTTTVSEPHGAQHIAPDAHGRNFYSIDRQFQDLLSLYLEPGLRAAMTPHFERLGALAGNRLDDLAMVADKHPPVLQPRDRFGLGAEAGQHVVVGMRPGQQHLEGDRAVEAQVPGPVDDAHAAMAEQRLHPVAGNLRQVGWVGSGRDRVRSWGCLRVWKQRRE